MSLHPIIIHYGGRWERSDYYVGGQDTLVYVPMEQITRAYLINVIREALCCTRNTDYSLFFFTCHNGSRRVKILLQRDTDLFRLIFEQKEDAELYVVERDNHEYVPQVDVNVRVNNPAVENENQSIPSENEATDSSDDEEEASRRDLLDSVLTEFGAWIRQPGHMDQFRTHRNFSSLFEARNDDDGSNNVQKTSLRNWVIPVPEVDDTLGWVEPSEPIIGKLAVGSTFRRKSDLKIAVGMYHMENQVECVTNRSSRDRLGYNCKQGRNNCTFRLCAAGSDDSLWRITKLTLGHSCYTNLDRSSARQVTVKVAASFFSRRLVDNGTTLKPKDMIDELRRLYGIGIDYSFALRTRNLAIEMAYGDFETSYNRLVPYLYLLKQRNADTFYDVSCTSDGVFCHMFLALGQSIHAFENYLRPVIVIDGTHLKGKNKGILFVAVTKDGNEQIFPLAIGLGPIENDESWTWFLANLRRCYPTPDELIIVSDQHKSITNAVQNIYPNVPHGSCFHHLQKNLTPYGQHVAALFKSAAYAYRVETFEKHFSDLQVLSPDGAHKRLSDIGVERWARSKCHVRRYSFMTSNAAESMNARLVWARRLPVCSLVEVFRSILENWFDERRAKASSRNHELTEEAYTKLSTAVELSRHLVVRETTTHMYKVEEEKLSYLVDLQSWTCDCREFDQDQIPCRHAAAAIRYFIVP